MFGFIAGLGALGFIIGFATKDIFSNFAAGILLLIYKPFKVGDKVEIIGLKGIINEINLSACILLTEKNEWTLLPNSKIWGNPIKNFSK